MSQQTEKKITWQDIKTEIEELIDKRLRSIEDKLKHGAQEDGGGEAPYMRPGKMIAVDEGDHQIVSCPNCGTTDLGFPKAEKIVEKVKEVVPQGYIPAPKTHAEIIQLLDAKDEKGHTVFDCPDCRGELKNWLARNQNQLKKL